MTTDICGYGIIVNRANYVGTRNSGGGASKQGRRRADATSFSPSHLLTLWSRIVQQQRRQKQWNYERVNFPGFFCPRRVPPRCVRCFNARRGSWRRRCSPATAFVVRSTGGQLLCLVNGTHKRPQRTCPALLLLLVMLMRRQKRIAGKGHGQAERRWGRRRGGGGGFLQAPFCC